MKYEEKTLSVQHVFDGKILDLDVLEVELPNGKKARREVIYHPGACAVVALNENNEVYMVRQFRKPFEKELFEIPAGKLDKGEDPKICAARELKEETGLIAKNLKHLITVFSSPGFCNEKLDIYLATDLEESEAQPDEDEFLDYVKVPMEKLLEMIKNNQINDGKSVVGILLALKEFQENKK